MSSLLRRPAGLARLAGHYPLSASLRASTRTTRVLRASSVAWAVRSQQRSYAANQKPPPPKNDPKRKKSPPPPPSKSSSEGAPRGVPEMKNADSPGPTESTKDAGRSGGRPPPPEGFVYLTEAELKAAEEGLAKMFVPGRAKEEFFRIVREMNATQYGVPTEIAELLRRTGSPEPPSLIEIMRLSAALPEMMRKLMSSKAMKDASPSQQYMDSSSDKSKKSAEDEGKVHTSEEGKKASEEGEQEQKQHQNKSNSQPDFMSNGSQKNNGLDATTTVVTLLVAWWLYDSMGFSEGSKDITWQELRKNFLDKGLVEKMVVYGRKVRVDLNREAVQAMYPDSPAANPGFHYYFSIASVEAFERRLDEAQEELGIPSSDRIPVSYASESSFMNVFLAFGPTLLLVGLLVWVSRRGPGGSGSSGIFSFSKSKAKRFSHESSVKVKFSDVAGLDEAKVEILEFVNFLKKPDKFLKLGAKIPRGAILAGPPGTGKTLLAKATAGESGVPFFTVSGSEFVEMFVGVGASRVRDLFAQARKSAPCIVFIDEIDAIGRSRAEGQRFGGNDEREATLNQILTEMDGFNTTEQVVVLAGTNRVEVLDKALMRPGRFDRHITIDAPTMKGRQDIFKVYLPKVVTAEDIEYLSGRLASLTPGFAGADIANCVNEAALIAARANADTITLQHFEQAIERVVGGLERKSLVMNPVEKKTVAYHEAGHAICGWFFEHADPLLKVSIVPRGKAMGYAQYMPEGDAFLMSESQLMDRMAMTLGGRISEEIHFPTVTTGASDDFNKVTRMARLMVTQWGMSKRVGPVFFDNDESKIHKPFAESTGQAIDEEIKRIVEQAYKQCKDLLTEKKKEVGIVAEELLKKEMLVRDDMIRLLGPRPFKHGDNFSKFFQPAEAQPEKQNQGPPPPPPTPHLPDAPEPPAAPAMFKEVDGKDAR
ncbi:ATP-dependent metallopeptidase Hfl [Xylariaceae sp. FL0804]|nr:ATP-dependent metallopeptidase Hfl [Xylariaceae sp. FL0804]